MWAGPDQRVLLLVPIFGAPGKVWRFQRVKFEATWQCRTFKWVGCPPGKLLTPGPVSSLAGVVVTSRLMRRYESKRGGIAANAAVKVG